MKPVSIKRTTLIVMTFTFLSYVLGFARESYIAFKFGASGLTDTFFIAAVVPDMVAGIISNALTNAFVPILKREKHTPTGSPQLLINTVMMYAAILAFLLMSLGYVLRGDIIHLLAPSFSHLEYLQATKLLRIMIVSVFFSSLSGILWGIYNANESYLLPAMIGVVANSLMLIAMVTLANRVGIASLGYGLVLGVFGRFAVQFVPLLRSKQLGIPKALWHPAIRDITFLIPPILISTGLGTTNLIVDRVLASGLPGGQLTDLNFATKLGFLPAGLIGASVATTLYTRFVTHTLEHHDETLQHILQTALVWMTFLGLFIGIIFNFFGIDILALLYHHGAFSYRDVLLADGPLRAYGWFLCFYLIQPILVRFFYARHDNRFIMWASLLAVGINILASILMVHPLGILGLALGNCLAQFVFVVSLITVMAKRLRWNLFKMIRTAFSLSFPPALSFLTGCVVISIIWNQTHTTPLVWKLTRDCAEMMVGLLLLLVVARLSRRSLLKGVLWR